MKTFILFIFLICSYNFTTAQSLNCDEEGSYAIINDVDGFVNIHKEKDSKSEIIGKIEENNIFLCVCDNTNWWKVYRMEKIHNIEGYIYKSRVLFLPEFKNVRIKKVANNSYTGQYDSITVIVKTAIFNPKTHRLFYSKAIPGQNQSELEKIDNKSFWGTDGEIPKTAITAVEISINGKSVYIPKNTFNDLFEPNFNRLSIAINQNGIVYISMLNSDGAGAYTAVWTIKNHIFLNRYIDRY